MHIYIKIYIYRKKDEVVHSLVHLFGCSLVQLARLAQLFRSFARSLVRLFDRSLPRSLARSIGRSEREGEAGRVERGGELNSKRALRT
jgi:hypothetical protein